MLHTKVQASEPSGSEEEDFLIFLCISMGQPRTPLAGAIFGPGTFFGTNLVIDQQVTLHSKFEAPEPSSSGEE